MRGKGNGGAGAILEDQSEASVKSGGPSWRSGARAWWWGSEEPIGQPGRKPAAAAGGAAVSLGVSEGEGWLEPS